MKHIQNILFVLFLLLVTSSLAQSQILYGAATGTGTDSGNAILLLAGSILVLKRRQKLSI